MSYINPLLGGNPSLGGVQMALAAAYESRIHTFSRMSTPRAQFAGDTAVTLTDGSYNSRNVLNASNVSLNPGNDIPSSATAQLASTSNARLINTDGGGRPIVIRALKDPFTAEIYDYAVFNADGTFPGCDANGVGGVNPLTFNTTTHRWELNNQARYLVNKETGEIYVNKIAGIREHYNPDGLVDTNNNNSQDILTAAQTYLEGKRNVVGMVDFEGLQGGALSSAQQQASELSGIIASLTSVLRTVNESKKTTLGLIR